jgi:5,6,7,8-tetrahydromethanopterin hydro-lyase
MPHDAEWYDGRMGEAWAGDVPNGSHVNVAIGRRGSPTAAAIVGEAGATTQGHMPIYVCLGGDNAVRPITVFRNKVPITDLGSDFARITWGAGQLGVGQGVLDAVADGLIPPPLVDELVLLAAIWVDPDAHDETAVRLANRAAMRGAIADAVAEQRGAKLADLLGLRETARNAYYAGD